MANRVLDYFGVLVGFSGHIDASPATSRNWMPWGHGDKDVVCGVPVPLELCRSFL